MSDALPEFEVVNSVGSSETLIGTTEIVIGQIKALPAIAGKFIENFVLENNVDITDRYTNVIHNQDTLLFYSIDGGNTFDNLVFGQGIEVTPKQTKQVIIKANAVSVPYTFRANYEVFQ
jgi:hypothetical protein